MKNKTVIYKKLLIFKTLQNYQTPYNCNSTAQKHKYSKTILEINENATLVFSISFQHGLVHQNFVFIRQQYFTYSIKRSSFVLIDCQYVLFKSTC